MTAASPLLRAKTTYAPGDAIDCGDYVLHLKVNARARRISLRIDNKSGDAVVTAPKPKLLGDAVDFARSRHDWIVSTRRGQSRPQAFAPGQVLTIKGHEVTLASRAGAVKPKPVQQDDGSWLLVSSGEPAVFARRIERYLRQQALKAFQAETAKYVTLLGLAATDIKVSLFDAKGRWGSCTPQRKAIRYSWRVIMAPRAVLSYLSAHEVAHLKHPDHSPRFWAEVTALYGADWKPARDWLKKNGHDLFKYQ